MLLVLHGLLATSTDLHGAKGPGREHNSSERVKGWAEANEAEMLGSRTLAMDANT